MNIRNIIRAWRDQEFREELTDEELAKLPDNPAGEIELFEDELNMIDGGLTETAVSRLHSHCDLAVLGSNYLRVQLETGYHLPLPLLEEN